ncbi:DUF2911 domain-containing protein [Fulvivirga lutea]|uniref:DUF2911 domain-containing protein n=1 Tax=Fulvivirga lutea TaxID=2810512 RepID=A0A975A119_9BACT|nr:DUF2911 domain-containing protein [Fulvivirga lutea]QSE97959.1 DUF2911 domain-containing protein [Fulvivirga lutea]
MKKLIVVAGVLIAVVAAAFIGMRIYTKSFSPEGNAVYSQDSINIEVSYGRPYKKNRQIFGGLVPYGEVWRTGANEPTTFTTNVDLMIGSEKLPKGTYSLFTIPEKDSWNIIFNSNIPGWGVNFSGEAAREPSTDVVNVEVSAISTKSTFEQFTIDFEQMHNEIDMILMWDQTLVVVPMHEAN